MPSNAIALTAVGLGLVIAGAAVGTSVQGLSRSAETLAPGRRENEITHTAPEATPVAIPALKQAAAPSTSVVIFNPDARKDGAYLRSYPSLTQGAIDGVLPNGTPVAPGRKVGQFIEVTTPSGAVGWVHSSMLATLR